MIARLIRRYPPPLLSSGSCLSLGSDRHLPHADLVVRVAGEQGLAVGGPGQGQALRGIRLRVLRHHLGAQLIDRLLVGQVLQFK